MRHGRQGRMTSLELHGVRHTRNNDRVRDIQAQMRVLLARTFSVFDLELPKKPVAVGGAWRSNAWSAMDFPSSVATIGGMEVRSVLTAVNGSVATLETTGEGVRGPALFDLRGNPVNLWDLKVHARTTFDLAQGQVLERELAGQGVITPSSLLANGSDVSPYTLMARLRRVAPGEVVEPRDL